jgi:hypothetical protein
MKRPAAAMNKPMEALATAAVVAPPPAPSQEALVVAVQLLTQIYIGESDHTRRQHLIAVLGWMEDFLES